MNRSTVGDFVYGWLETGLRIKRSETAVVAWSFLYFFFLLSSYYVLRPIRDEMGIQGGVENLPWMFTGTFVGTLIVVPIFGWIASRVSKKRIVPAFYLLFLLTLIGFFGLLKSDLYPRGAAIGFFIWLSVFNLFVVSVFWSFMVDVYEQEQTERLFGFIAAGGTTGAIVGPTLTTTLPPLMGTDNLLLVSAVLLAGTLLCIHQIFHYRTDSEPTEEGEGKSDRSDPLEWDDRIGGHLFDGLTSLFRSPYLLGIGLFIVLYSGTSTFVYFEQANIIEQLIDRSARRTQVFALMDFGVNGLTIGCQLFFTGRLIDAFGPTPSLTSLPVVTVVGFLALAVSPVLLSVIVFQIVRRSSNYALARPAREVLFSPLSDSDKYKGKNVVDTVVYRGGDAVTGWFFAGLQGVGLGLFGISIVGAGFAAGWILISLALGFSYARRSSPEPAYGTASGKQPDDDGGR